jgi:NAD(P)-dependent dehydrogenase (short-subunit alcohol dehydrogenase family)
VEATPTKGLIIMTLPGTRVVVLGGTAGIGLAAARAAAGAGADVVVVSSRKTRVEQALADLPAGAEGHAVDLTDEAAIESLFAQVGPFDHLVYTAGDPLVLGELGSLGLDAMRAGLDVRVWGALTAAKHARPHLRPGASITLTTGAAGRRPAPGWTVVATSCGALESLTRALAVELAPIRVNAVMAGMVKTDLWAPVAGPAAAGLFEETGRGLPVGRVGEPEDLAAAYLYLMGNGFSTGAIVEVDGGHVLV